MVLHTDLLICNKSDRYIHIMWVCCMGAGMVTSFWSMFVLGGG